MAKPTKRKVAGGRVTPKGGPAAHTPRPTSPSPEANARYTPPVPHEMKVSPPWLPVVMFVLLGAGTLMILLNYTGVLWSTNNWFLISGLGCILAGIVAATQYH
ncbi:MAG: cell division protein CrgA [Acidimicrobiia bacterium]